MHTNPAKRFKNYGFIVFRSMCKQKSHKRHSNSVAPSLPQCMLDGDYPNKDQFARWRWHYSLYRTTKQKKNVVTRVKHSDITSLRLISTEHLDSSCPFYLATLCTQYCSGCTDKLIFTLILKCRYQFCACVHEQYAVLGEKWVVLDTAIECSLFTKTYYADEFAELARRCPHKSRILSTINSYVLGALMISVFLSARCR